ncbi:bifunctional diguanylate cyclase/phosphodiesterase [Roseibium litorale]|uniref:EAL domain-containing protein n=1 Tax=Roseibium litorale TaxID=2803841 RepID=A0ABR9CQM4_9HYPH|nr:EAL domain-containing protein [Roseibium litorale]MBD8892978.1 EAL domain-containing protein [Roseibium litorale]
MQETRGFSARMDMILLHWSKNGRHFVRPLKIALICFFVALFLSLLTFNATNELRHVNRTLDRKADVTRRLLDYQNAQAIAGVEKTLEALIRMPQMEKAFQSGETSYVRRLLEQTIPLLSGNGHISELALYDTNLQLLPAQKALPEASFSLSSSLLKQSARTGNLVSGLEPGTDGSPAVMAIAPWRKNGEIAGYVRIGAGMRQTLQFIHSTLGVSIIEFQPVQRISREPGSTGAGQQGWLFAGNQAYRPIGKSVIPSDISSRIGASANDNWLPDRLVWTDGQLLMTSLLALPYADGQNHSSLLISHDITEDALTLLKSLTVVLLLLSLIAIITWALFSRMSHGLQKAVLRTRRKLERAVQHNTKALERQKDRLEEAQRIAAVGSWERNLRTGEIVWSDQIYQITGIPHSTSLPEAVKTYYDMVPEEDLRRLTETVNAHMETCTPFEIEHQLIRKDGEVRHVHVRCNIEAGDDGKAARLFGTTRDITEQHNALDRSQWLAGILEASLNEIYIFDGETFKCEHANRCARENLGYSDREILDLYLWDISQEANRESLLKTISDVVEGRLTSVKVESRHKRKDGTTYPVEVQLQAHKSRSKTSLIAICNDISERIKREKETQLAREEAERLAYFDALTRLPNRAACQRDAKAAFAPGNSEKPAFIIHIDIDNFKRINDTLGHSAGDACLEETGERLQTGCFGLGTAYRWGGDEFVILASGPHSDAEELCERLNLVMRGPMEYEGNQIWPSVSMGVACCPDDGEDFSSLLVHADLALYRSKDEGKDRWSYFTSDMKIDSDEEARLEQELRLAFRRDEFFLVFQPQVNNRTQQVTGVEALVRWQHPTRGVLAPGSFLNVIEKTSLAVPLGQIVLDKAIAAAGKWKKAGLHFGRMAVNLSPSHLPSGTLLQDFLTAMAKYDVGPELLTAEVLESVFLDTERNHNWQVLEELYDQGVHIELDDFGTGYASLSHVADLPINGLKIDRSFTAQILTDNKKEIVVNHLIHLARALNIDVVCEGVETETQFERLRMMGNFSVQGYLIARPMPFEQFTSWLEASPGDLAFFS